MQRVEAVVGNWKEEGEVARRCRGGDAQPTEGVRPHRRGGGHDGRLCARRGVALFIIIFMRNRWSPRQ